MCCSTSTDRNMLTISCRANSVQATNDLVTSTLITTHGHITLTCALPEFSSFPMETKMRTIVVYLVLSLDKFLGSKALMTRNTGPTKQSKHQHAFCSSQDIPELYLQSGLLLLLCTWRSVNGTPSHFTEHSYPRDPASCSSPITLPLRNICTREGCSSKNAFRMQHNQHQKGRSICWKFPKRSKVLISAIIHIQRWTLPHPAEPGSPTQLFL